MHTVLSFVQTYEPFLLDLFPDVGACLRELQERAENIAARKGLSPLFTYPPDVLPGTSHPMAMFPVEIWMDTFDV